jgi:hypothetical protein
MIKINYMSVMVAALAPFAGGVVWYKMPLFLYAVHAGGAFVKTLTVIIGVWRG